MLSHLQKHALYASQPGIHGVVRLKQVLVLKLGLDHFCVLLGVNLLVLLDLLIKDVHFLFVLSALLHQVANIDFLAFD